MIGLRKGLGCGLMEQAMHILILYGALYGWEENQIMQEELRIALKFLVTDGTLSMTTTAALQEECVVVFI